MIKFRVVDRCMTFLFETGLRADQAHVWGPKTFEVNGVWHMYWSDFVSFVEQLIVE